MAAAASGYHIVSDDPRWYHAHMRRVVAHQRA